MTGRNGFVERRKHERFEVKTGAFAGILNTSSDYTHIGEIINISKGGLLFSHTSVNGGPEEPFNLDILFVQGIVSIKYVSNIPIETAWISDAVIEQTSSRLKTEAIGVKFKELSPQQQIGLDGFIQKCTNR